MISLINKCIFPIKYNALLFKSLSLFTIKNYMKTYQLENVQRTKSHQDHNIFRVDEYRNFVQSQPSEQNQQSTSSFSFLQQPSSQSSSSLQQFLSKQSKNYVNKSKLWSQRTKQYYALASSRRDTRTKSIQQQYDQYSYYTTAKYFQEKQYTIMHRRDNRTQRDEIVLDIMQYYSLKKHYKTIQLLRTSFSGTHRYLAFGYDLNNNQHVRWMIKDTKQNKILGVKGWEGNVLQQANQVVFYKDIGIFYTKCINRRPSQLYYQQFDSQPILLLQQKDEQYWLYIELSKDKQQLIINSSSKSNTKIKCLSLESFEKSSQLGKLLHHLNVGEKKEKKNSIQKEIQILFLKAIRNIYSSSKDMNEMNEEKEKIRGINEKVREKIIVNHISNRFIIWRQKLNESTISLLDDRSLNPQSERIIHTLHQQQQLTDIDVFQETIALYIQKNTKPILRLIHFTKETSSSQINPSKAKSLKTPQSPPTSQSPPTKIQDIPLPYTIGKISPGMNQLTSPSTLFYYLSTPFIYNQGYQYNFTTKKSRVIQQYKYTGPKFNSNKYQIKTIEVASANDGEMIPLTIISQKQNNILLSKRRNPRKLMLKVYGFYGLNNQVTYDNMNFPLLQNGWTIVYAHVRGGSEKGSKWHLQAIQNPQLRWSDLQDCVAFLLKQNYTHPSLLCLQSHSAGAITVWNMINKSSHLFKAVILNYPFLDVLNSLLNQKDTLSASDYNEFGNPIASKRAFRQIESISPYQNIQQNKQYPFIYIIGGMNDYRCPVEQLVKFVMRYRAISSGNNNRFKSTLLSPHQKGILLKIHQNSSHLGSSNISEQNYNVCQVYGFLDHLIYQGSNDCCW